MLISLKYIPVCYQLDRILQYLNLNTLVQKSSDFWGRYIIIAGIRQTIALTSHHPSMATMGIIYNTSILEIRNRNASLHVFFPLMFHPCYRLQCSTPSLQMKYTSELSWKWKKEKDQHTSIMLHLTFIKQITLDCIQHVSPIGYLLNLTRLQLLE